MEKSNLDPYLTPYIKSITNPNGKVKKKSVKENIGEHLCNLGVGKDFLNRPKKNERKI